MIITHLDIEKGLLNLILILAGLMFLTWFLRLIKIIVTKKIESKEDFFCIISLVGLLFLVYVIIKKIRK